MRKKVTAAPTTTAMIQPYPPPSLLSESLGSFGFDGPPDDPPDDPPDGWFDDPDGPAFAPEEQSPVVALQVVPAGQEVQVVPSMYTGKS